MALVEQGDELGTDDGSGSVGVGRFQGLLVANTEADDSGRTEVHGIDAAEVGLLGIIEMLLGTGDGGAGDHVDEAIGIVVDEADAFLRGLGSDEHDDAEIIAVGKGLDLAEVVIEGEVGDNHATDACFSTGPTKGLYTIVEDGIEVAHEDEGDGHLVLDGFQLGEECLQVHAVLQGLSGGGLDDGTVSERVAEGDADFNKVDASSLHRLYHIAGSFECRTAGTEIEGEEFAVATVGEELVYLIHSHWELMSLLVASQACEEAAEGIDVLDTWG